MYFGLILHSATRPDADAIQLSVGRERAVAGTAASPFEQAILKRKQSWLTQFAQKRQPLKKILHTTELRGNGLVVEADSQQVGRRMSILKWALIFLVISVVAGVFGFTGISAASADVARVLFYIFIIIFLVLLVLGLTIFRA